jgi:hypothetical protein
VLLRSSIYGIFDGFVVFKIDQYLVGAKTELPDSLFTTGGVIPDSVKRTIFINDCILEGGMQHLIIKTLQ